MSDAPTLLRFGVFELDLETRELRRRGRLVALPAQPFVVLARLAAQPGVVVSREALCRELWPEDVHVDQERGLNFCVNRVRRALGDSARHPRYLETVPRQGYRLLVAPSPVLAPASFVVPTAPRAQGPRIALLLGVLLFQVAALPHRSAAGEAGLPSLDPHAQAAFAAGRRALDEGPAGWRRSVTLFSEAARRDRGFALARYGLADAYMRLGENGALPVEQAFPAARSAVRAALALEDRAEPLVILAALELDYDWNWSAAERDYAHALRLDPELAGARLGYARLLSASGRHAEARALVRAAETRAPADPEVLREAAFVAYRARAFDEADRLLGRWAELAPEAADAPHWHALLLHLTGRTEEARREARKVLLLSHPEAGALARFDALSPEAALAHYLRGSLAFLERLAGTRAVGRDDFARLEALLGDSAAALNDLERAADERSPNFPTALADPAFDGLRTNPRFVRLQARLAAPEEVSHPALASTVAALR